MKVTRRVIEGYIACKYKGYLLISGKSGQLHDLEIVRTELQEAYGPQATAALVAKCRKSSPATTPDLRSGHELILGPTLEDDQTAFAFDALRRLDGESALGPFHYGPVLFWHRDSVTAAETRLLAAGGLILARHQGVQPKTGTLVCGSSCTVRTVKLTNHYRAVQNLLDSALAMASDSAAPTLRLNDHCGVCEFRDDCRRQALESDDLSLLGKITDKQINDYRQKGLFTVTALSYTFRARRGKLVHPKCRPRSLPLHALAIRQQRILVVGKPTFPTADVRIYFDAEGDPERKFNYLLGLLIVKDGKEELISLWADDPSQQINLFNQFLEIVGRYPKYTLFHYGTYESALLRQMRAVVRNKRAVGAVMAASVNILAPLFSDVYFPTFSNSLKDIARYLGVSWTDAKASGLQSLAWRARWEQTGDDTFKQQLITYNGEDCRALKLVTEALEAIGRREQVTAHGTEVKVEEVSFEPNSRSWGKIGYLLPDLDHVNKCAYFDYQRDRLHLRDGSRPRSRKKRKPRRRQRWLRPHERHTIRVEVCPVCGSSDLEKQEKAVFTKQVYDLMATKSGLSRRVIEYRAIRARCRQCKNISLPPKYRRLCPFRHGVRSWAVYQHVAHQVSLERVATMIDDFFGLHLQHADTHMMKTIMSRYYRPTVNRLLEKLLAGDLIHVDETQITLRHEKGYVWVLANMEEVIYLYRPNREVAFLKQLLSGFKGVLVTDFYPAYDGMECRQQKCLIHLIRDMNSDLRLNSFDDELKLLVAQFGTLLRGIVKTIDRHGLKENWLKKHKPKVAKFYERTCCGDYRSQVALALRERLVKNREKLFTFLDYDGIPWNNNNAEHAVKQFAYYRTVAEGTMVESGLKDYLDLLSIRVTCDYKGVRFFPFLCSKVRDIDQFARGEWQKKRSTAVEVYPKGLPSRYPDKRKQKPHEGTEDAR